MKTKPLTDIKYRMLEGKADAMRLRQFLMDTYSLMGREFNWETRRWEGSYWYSTDAELADPCWGAHTCLWEAGKGEIVGAAIPDGPGEFALQIHPDYRFVEDEILNWAEEQLAMTDETGRHKLSVWAFDWDAERHAKLTQRGYKPCHDRYFQHRRREVHEPVPDVLVSQGYTIRSVDHTKADALRWVEGTNITFGHTHLPEMHRNFELYSPSYNNDLHLIAETSDGVVAAFAGLTVDKRNRTAVFEPVGTHPNHRRKGLASAVMFEGIRRLQALGTVDVVYVANWGPADAGKLYASVGMQHYATSMAWEKIF